MSEAVAALTPGRHEGFATVETFAPTGMITLRGDLSDADLRATAEGIARQPFPGPHEGRYDGATGLFWMSPDEVLILCPYAEVAANLALLEQALAGRHHLAVDVSDARAVFAVDGLDAREALGKLTPANLSPAVFGPGAFRRTRLAQVPAAVLCESETRFVLVCFRSVAGYVHQLLKTATIPGSEVGFWRD